jgi:hypothetical protein
MRLISDARSLNYESDPKGSLMRALWHKLPEKWKHCIGVVGAVLLLTVPFFLLALDNQCVQLTGVCH